ncbi:hypothetical protein [Cytobacillus praedii]|uniref:Uncharacterized protein n=1 Tax=Cytobacillus praedii TaxID=1742358 RepID=A0A4R1AMF2_9BACI|nr:hypothetical protein [Cytobacillus praedii]TCJ00450.1 hypothetical protein E0Y62_26835 [Cytobacillus praedii]
MEYVLLKDSVNVIDFVGIGKIDGKNVEIKFQASNFVIDHEDRENPKFIINPILDKTSLTFAQITTYDENKS